MYNAYEKKKEHYNTLTLKSENTYLKTYVSELEDDLNKVHQLNNNMQALVQKQELKIS